MLCSVLSPVKSRNACHLNRLAVVCIDRQELRLGDDRYAVIAEKGGFEHFKLLFTVVVRGASQHHDRRNTRKVADNLDGGAALLEPSVRPDAGLMEDVAGDDDDVRLFFRRCRNEVVDAAHNIMESGVFAVGFRARIAADMPVAGMKNFQSHNHFLHSWFF